MTVKKLPDRIECPECDGLMYFWDELRDYKYCAKCGYHEGTKKQDLEEQESVKVHENSTRPIKHSQIFPSDGICPECRAGQSKAEFNGNILIDGVPFEDKMILDELREMNKNLKSIEKLLSKLDDKFIKNKI